MKAIIKITNKNEKNIFFIINSKINEHVKKYNKINILNFVILIGDIFSLISISIIISPFSFFIFFFTPNILLVKIYLPA